MAEHDHVHDHIPDPNLLVPEVVDVYPTFSLPAGRRVSTPAPAAEVVQEPATTQPVAQTRLASGREVVVSQGQTELVEIRAADGQLELRIELTPQGPVLRMNAVRMELQAKELVQLKAERVEVVADKHLEVWSDGSMGVHSEKGTLVESEGEVLIQGSMLHLN